MKTKAKAKLGGALKVSTARSAQRHGGTISTSASAAQRKAAQQRQPKQRAKAASGTIPARKPAVDDSAWAALRVGRIGACSMLGGCFRLVKSPQNE